MSQNKDSPAPCADKGGHVEATISLCDALRSGARGHKKRNLATLTIVDPPTGKRKRKSWVWKVMQQFAPPIGKCSVRYSVEFSVFLNPRGKRVSENDCIGNGNACFTRWQFWASKISGIASSGTSRSILAGHQQPLHQLQRLRQPLRQLPGWRLQPQFCRGCPQYGSKDA